MLGWLIWGLVIGGAVAAVVITVSYLDKAKAKTPTSSSGLIFSENHCLISLRFTSSEYDLSGVIPNSFRSLRYSGEPWFLKNRV